MITTPTVLILGAGASMPFGFPSGAGLVKHICSGLGTLERAHIEFVLQALNRPADSFTTFVSALSKSGMLSIDAFLQHNPDFMLEGKLAIAASLIPCEIEDRLFGFTQNWYKTLLQQLNAPFDEFQNNKLSIITYNYDRSLEWFLLTALRNRNLGKSYEECLAKARSIPILHLHGWLGDIPESPIKPAGQSPAFRFLPENPLDPAGKSRAYDAKVDAYELLIAMHGIGVIHESIFDDPIFTRAKDLLSSAEIIAFLGFGYDLVNMRRLGLRRMAHKWKSKNSFNDNRPFFGTTYGLGHAKARWLDNYMCSSIFLSDSEIDAFLADQPVLIREMQAHELSPEEVFTWQS